MVKWKIYSKVQLNLKVKKLTAYYRNIQRLNSIIQQEQKKKADLWKKNGYGGIKGKDLTPDDIAFISESGIWNEEDAQYVAMAGAKGVLVGESLMRSGDVENSLKSLQIDITTKVGENR